MENNAILKEMIKNSLESSKQNRRILTENQSTKVSENNLRNRSLNYYENQTFKAEMN